MSSGDDLSSVVSSRRTFVVLALLFFVVTAGLFFSGEKEDPRKLLNQIIRSGQGGTKKELIARLEVFIEQHPDYLPALLARESYSSSVDESLEVLARIHKGPDEQLARVRLKEADLLLQCNRARQAEASYERAIQLNPQLPEPRQNMISFLAVQRRPEAVRRQLNALRQLRPLNLSEMAWFLAADESLAPADESIARLESFLQADPEDQSSLRGLCIYLSETARVAEAIERLEKKVDQGGAELDTIALLAEMKLSSGDKRGADEFLHSFAVSNETTALQWETLALYAFEKGEYQQARMAAEYAVSKSPFKRSAAFLYFSILNRIGETEAVKVWRARVDQLNSLHTEVDWVGISLLRGSSDATPVIRVAQLLLALDQPEVSSDWLQQAVLIGGTTDQTLSLQQRVTERLSGSRSKESLPALEMWASANERIPSSEKNATPAALVADAAGIHLVDRAFDLGLHMQYENGHTGFKYLAETTGGGVGVIDLDNDGWQDLYCPQGGTLGDGPVLPKMSDQLFRNLRGNQFQDITNFAGIQEFGYSQGIAVADIDQDGFDDVFVANVGQNTMFLNNGDGTFQNITLGSGTEVKQSMSSSAAFADLDSDGDPDLYVVNYVQGFKVCHDAERNVATCSPWAMEAATDELYENLGDGTFRDVTESSGLSAVLGKGLGIVIGHFDEDRRPDVFVTNDTTPNFLFRNLTETTGLLLQECGFESGVAVNKRGQAEAGMGIACGDLDHDLRQDLYVTNFYHEANRLLLQTTHGMFQDETETSGLRDPTLSFLGFGTQVIDFDGDGWDELFVANGHVDDQSSRGIDWKMSAQIFRTVDGTRWSDISSECGEFMSLKALGRGVARIDIRRDGKPGLAIGYQDRPMALLMNETPTVGNAFVCRLVGRFCNRNAINSTVRWTAGGIERTAEIHGGDGYYCSNERRLHLTLGEAEQIDCLKIIWPDETTDEHSNLAANLSYVIRQHLPIVEDAL
jgi:tetratricopeptide (TPR) repeat protein